MARPLLYEINTRCWLEAVRAKHGGGIDLGNIPSSIIVDWVERGFTHIWAMGVWTTGPLCRKHALLYWKPGALQKDPGICQSDDDIPGSPYAISAYRVPARLGGDAALARFRRQLHRHGLKLILDFVPNHVAIDHHWLIERPGLFVQSRVKREGAFRFPLPDEFDEKGAHLSAQAAAHPEHGQTTPWFANGRDPYFPAWSDTAQLDYRNAETQAAMRDLLVELAGKCDGVRCDMAMLALSDVFSATWNSWPSVASPAESEFWPTAIAAVREAHPGFLLIGEVYWDLEERLQAHGFDYTYDKKFFDLLGERNHGQLLTRLSQKDRAYLNKSLWFLENHDEARVAGRLSLPEHQAAAALMLMGLPGLPLIYEGQLEGWRRHLPVQVGRWPASEPDENILSLYSRILAARKNADIASAEWTIEQPGPRIVRVKWARVGAELNLFVNFSPEAVELELEKGLGFEACDRITGLPVNLVEGSDGLRLTIGPWEPALIEARR